ncbi:MAG: GGDEF domain-containing protein [Sulfurimonas sp.]|nr:GGDEF domain-containing protein [Sulfurimonas sp.]
MIFNYHPKLVEHMIDQTPKAILGLIVVSSIYIWIYSGYIPLSYLLIWIFLQILFIVFRFVNAKVLAECVRDGSREKIRRHVVYFFISIVCSAFIWTGATILGLNFAPSPYELVSLIMIIGLLTGSVLSLVPIFYIYIIYFFLMITPQLAIMILCGEHIHISVVFLTIFYIPLIVLLSKTIYKNYLNTIESNDSLENNVCKLHQLSITDSLTKVYNRRHFFEVSQDLIVISQREDKIVSFLMIDIDYFKNINDTYGHQAGDEILISLSQEIKNIVRESDVFARIGGEEFALLLLNTSLEGAKTIAGKIRTIIEKKHFLYEKKHIKMTVSIGVSALSESITTLENLYQKADTQLYSAKKYGRNRVC